MVKGPNAIYFGDDAVWKLLTLRDSRLGSKMAQDSPKLAQDSHKVEHDGPKIDSPAESTGSDLFVCNNMQ